MDASKVRDLLLEWTALNSGAEQRTYLGMSRIGECPLALYREMMAGGKREWTMQMHMNCYAGYLWEADIKKRLEAIGLYAPGSEKEVAAKFDYRFRGHTDGEITDGRLLEIKSTTQYKLDEIIKKRRIARRHFEQVQMYLEHGAYGRNGSALVVYVARDTGNLWVAEVRLIQDVAAKLNEKARMILAAVDTGVAPGCECGLCGMVVSHQ